MEDFMDLTSRIDTLRDRHRELDERITEETRRPRPDDDAVARLKLQKLHLKDEIARLTGNH
jgi:hypothetical protein